MGCDGVVGWWDGGTGRERVGGRRGREAERVRRTVDVGFCDHGRHGGVDVFGGEFN